MVYLSDDHGGLRGGVAYANEDILVYEEATGTYRLYFDGSDVGLTFTDLDALHLMDDPQGSILMSFSSTSYLDGVGWVADEDIVRFVPSQLGPSTKGAFQMYFDGSDVGLGEFGERVDAIAALPDGRLVLSTNGAFLPGVGYSPDEDLLLFTPSSFGSTTRGSFARFFDGSKNGLLLNDLTGAWIDPLSGQLHLTAAVPVIGSGFLSFPWDIFRCEPGTDQRCRFEMVLPSPRVGRLALRIDGQVLDACSQPRGARHAVLRADRASRGHVGSDGRVGVARASRALHALRMSKAFTKNDAGTDLMELVTPRAPLPPDTPNYVTVRGLRLLREELATLEAERADLAAGDDEVRRAALPKLAARIGEVSARIVSAVLVDPTAQPQDRVRFGARVGVRGLDGAERTYRIVGVDEADVKEGRIAFVAPIARALLGKSIGDVVTFQSPRGAEELELIDVQYDDDP